MEYNSQDKLEREVTKLDLEADELRLKISDRLKGDQLADRTLYTIARDDRVFFHRGFVDWDSLDRLMLTVEKWKDYASRAPLGKLVISITSPGGDVFSGFGHYDLIRDACNEGLDIEMQVQGFAASMAAVIVQAGKHRTIGTNGWLMFHEAATVRQQLMSLAEMRDQTELLDTIQDRLVSIVAERSTLSTEDITARTYKKDWWLSAQDSLEYGFVDEITGGRHV